MSGRPGKMPHVAASTLAAVFAGGMVGTLGRAGLAESLPTAPGAWPWATFAANLAGTFLLGWTLARLPRLAPSTFQRAFVGTGLCGALTTFSAVQLELLRMLDSGAWALALGYAAASLSGGLAVVALARVLAHRGRRMRVAR